MTNDAPAPPNLTESLPPYVSADAVAEANRCLYCFDAPCMHACPTHIDIPTFIRKIATDNLRGSALTILDSNILGRTCARVCPVEELCEGACVLNDTDKPIEIGRLQRHATDWLAEHDPQPYRPGTATGRSVLVAGSGPAGLSAAAELAKLGHDVTIWERRPMGGGLSTYGIIPLREPTDVALAEVDMIGDLGVTIETDRALEDLDAACTEFDAVFLGLGLGQVPPVDIVGGDLVVDGLDYITAGKLAPQTLPAARRVAVIGAGNTAIDAATIAARTGAQVTMVYRRSLEEMTAYEHEYAFACSEGIEFRFLTQPVEVLTAAGVVTGLRCVRMELGEPDDSGRARPTPVADSEVVIEADLVIRAIGQERFTDGTAFGLQLVDGYIDTDADLRTSRPGVWAGGDGVRARGDASTVMAVQDGKLAAADIHRHLTANPIGG